MSVRSPGRMTRMRSLLPALETVMPTMTTPSPMWASVIAQAARGRPSRGRALGERPPEEAARIGELVSDPPMTQAARPTPRAASARLVPVSSR